MVCEHAHVLFKPHAGVAGLPLREVDKSVIGIFVAPWPQNSMVLLKKNVS